jgi:hypothetical protein
LTGQGPEESGTDACAVEEEDGSTEVIVAVLSGGRRLGVVLRSKASRGRTGTSVSMLEAGQRRAHRRSSGPCGEAEAVLSEERGGENRLCFDDSRWAAMDKDGRCTWGRRDTGGGGNRGGGGGLRPGGDESGAARSGSQPGTMRA